MDYAQSITEHISIGSGMTEVACKTIVKQRLCQSGMKWLEKGASIVLCLRTLAALTSFDTIIWALETILE